MRATAKLSGKLERGLLAYTTSAGAAAVLGVLSVPSANAKVVYTSAHVVIGTGGTNLYNLDLNHDGLTDFKLRTSYSCDTYCSYDFLVSGGYIECEPRGGWASTLRRGSEISSKHSPFFVRAYMVRNGGGPWANVKNRYLGLKFEFDGQTHYGWARLSVKVNGTDVTATLTGYAYETIPDKPVIAGIRGSTTGQGPDAKPASLGHLALGAAWRKQHARSIAVSR